jgi:hypothetical protein
MSRLMSVHPSAMPPSIPIVNTGALLVVIAGLCTSVRA